MISELPLELVLAQHMFSAFMWAIAEHIPKDIISGSETTGPDGHETSPSPKREDTVIHRLAAALQRVELARTPEEALMCIIPPLSYVDKLPHISDPVA